jgi:hypothetical protein
MPSLTNWMAGEGQPDAIAEVISYKSTTTGTITRGSGTASAVNIRLETLSGDRQMQGQGGITYQIDAFALAVFGTDLRVGDRFTVAGRTFEVIAIAPGMTDNLSAYLKLRA